MPNRRFEGKLVIITGGARGQGAEEARRLAAEGAKVVVTDVLAHEGQLLSEELGDAMIFIHHDVADELGWQSVVTRSIEFGGAVDLLVNNAGILRLGTLAETSSAEFDLHQQINVRGPFLGTKYCAPEMVKRGGGSIVNVSSLLAMRAHGGDSAYVTSKWAVRGMTKSAARELAVDRIRVNSVHPGIILTPMLDGAAEGVVANRAAQVPLGRAGSVADVANLVLFLLSDEASYITGAEIVVDGGLGI